MFVLYSDSNLVELIRNDTATGMEIVIDLYGGAVKTICQEILSGFSNEDIEEAISDSFTALWQSIDNYDLDRGSCLKSYLYGIARRTALNKRRKLSKAPSDYKIDCFDFFTSDNLETEMVKKAETEILRQLIIEMKSPDREIFIKRYFLSMPIKDIASDMNITCKTVENKLFRGKKNLKKQLIKRGVICE